MISKETQKKIDEITPKLSFVNCVTLVSRLSQRDSYFEKMRQTINAMSQPEQQELAKRWENRFYSNLQFASYLALNKKERDFWKEKGVVYEN